MHQDQSKSKTIVFNKKVYPCTTSLTMGLIGGKWKTVILKNLKGGNLRYNELRKSMPTVTERTLSLQLKSLEEDGLVQRRVYHKNPPIKVVYLLTDFGKTIIPLVDAITEWGEGVVENHIQ